MQRIFEQDKSSCDKEEHSPVRVSSTPRNPNVPFRRSAGPLPKEEMKEVSGHHAVNLLLETTFWIPMTIAEEEHYDFWKKVLENCEDEMIELACTVKQGKNKPATKWGNISVPFKFSHRWTSEKAAGNYVFSQMDEKQFWGLVMAYQDAERQQMLAKEKQKWKALHIPCKYWHQLIAERSATTPGIHRAADLSQTKATEEPKKKRAKKSL